MLSQLQAHLRLLSFLVCSNILSILLCGDIMIYTMNVFCLMLYVCGLLIVCQYDIKIAINNLCMRGTSEEGLVSFSMVNISQFPCITRQLCIYCICVLVLKMINSYAINIKDFCICSKTSLYFILHVNFLLRSEASSCGCWCLSVRVQLGAWLLTWGYQSNGYEDGYQDHPYKWRYHITHK